MQHTTRSLRLYTVVKMKQRKIGTVPPEIKCFNTVAKDKIEPNLN